MSLNDSLKAFSKVSENFVIAKLKYDLGENPLSELYEIGVSAACLLANHTTIRSQGDLVGGDPRVTKLYDVFLLNDSNKVSRPVRSDLYLKDPGTFKRAWIDLMRSIDHESKSANSNQANAAIYTCICAFACAFDLFKPGSRKTPGTFFEILIGTILADVSGLKRGKQISIPNSQYKVPTDIVLINPDGPQLVIPTKITTRERIVQVWSQQRILQDVFGKGEYLSILVSMSELQRDGEDCVSEICVPGQVGLFQKFLADVSGMYYLDVPKSYQSKEIIDLLNVSDFGILLSTDLKNLLKA